MDDLRGGEVDGMILPDACEGPETDSGKSSFPRMRIVQAEQVRVIPHGGSFSLFFTSLADAPGNERQEAVTAVLISRAEAIKLCLTLAQFCTENLRAGIVRNLTAALNAGVSFIRRVRHSLAQLLPQQSFAENEPEMDFLILSRARRKKKMPPPRGYAEPQFYASQFTGPQFSGPQFITAGEHLLELRDASLRLAKAPEFNRISEFNRAVDSSPSHQTAFAKPTTAYASRPALPALFPDLSDLALKTPISNPDSSQQVLLRANIARRNLMNYMVNRYFSADAKA